MQRLSVKGLAIGLGVCWGLCIGLSGWIAIWGWGKSFVEVMSSVYIGFAPTPLGGIIGMLWGFIDGAIGGAIIALVYNAVIKKGD